MFRRCFAVIYFGKITTEECKELFDDDKKTLEEKRKKNRNIPSYTNLQYQIRPFIEAGETRDAKFISILEQNVYVYEPDSSVRDLTEEESKKFVSELKKQNVSYEDTKGIELSIPKIRFVKKPKIFRVGIPYILRTLNINQYFNKGTCREIKESDYWEIIQAIKVILEEERDIPASLSLERLFKLLSPHQFETLIFLTFTNAGLYVPAWRAGSFPDIDIIGKNCSDLDVIDVGTNPTIYFKKNEEITFQVKRKENQKEQNTIYTIALSSSHPSNVNILSSEWLWEVIKQQTRTKIWLENSLQWFIKDTGIKSIFELLNSN